MILIALFPMAQSASAFDREVLYEELLSSYTDLIRDLSGLF
jgi:hypothetical protein